MTNSQPLNFGGLEAEYTAYDAAKYVVLPVPYDRTSTWKQGADQGPKAILEASANMELYDIETDAEPYLAGIHTLAPIVCEAPPDELYEQVLAVARKIISDGKVPVTLGGNHCVPIGSARAACEPFEREQVSVLQIDAHSDLRDSYQGSAFSHACAMARMQEWGQPVGVGIRSMDISEKENVAKASIFTADYIHKHPNWVDEVVAKLAPNVYLTIDLDGLDPSIMPATGTPEPGGLLWYQVMDLLEKVIASRKLLGFDIVELCPQPGFFHAEFLAAKLTYKIMALNEAAAGAAK